MSHSPPLHPQGSYAHCVYNLSSSPGFHTDPLTWALWPRHSLISELEGFVLVLQRLLICILNSPKITYNKASLGSSQHKSKTRTVHHKYLTGSQGSLGYIRSPHSVITNSIILLMENKEYLLRKGHYTHLCSEEAATLPK